MTVLSSMAIARRLPSIRECLSRYVKCCGDKIQSENDKLESSPDPGMFVSYRRGDPTMQTPDIAT